MLEIRDLSVRFGGLVALDNVSVSVPQGTFCGIIGPNGAGKTTFFNAISRFIPVERGEILIDGQNIAAARSCDVAAAGISRTFQHLGIFSGLTVEENIRAGALSRSGLSTFAELLGLRTARRKRAELDRNVVDLAELCGLRANLDDRAAELPFGMLKRLELARALATRPRVLLLDEPAGGLSRREVDEFLKLLMQIREQLALTIVMIEHHLGLVMSASDHIVVLNFGRKIAEGTAAQLRNDPEVISAYLGRRRL